MEQRGTTADTVRIVSLGYQGRTADDVARLLRAADVSTLIDVRLNAVSRKPGLSKTRLRERLAADGIGYAHLRALGNPKDNRAGFADPGGPGGLDAAGRFRELLGSEPAREHLQQAAELARTGTVALLCFERDPAACHRHVVATELTVLLGDAHVDPL